MDNELQLWLALAYCAIITVLAILFKKFPPKKLNHIYGYRTHRSMKNETTWKVANEYSSNLMLKFSIYSFLIPAICYLLAPANNLLISLFGNSILIILVVLFTEIHLKKMFDANGELKSHS